MMIMAIIIMWIIWLVPVLLYIYWKRGDWYLLFFPPVIISIIARIVYVFSEMLSVLSLVLIHIILLVIWWNRIKK